MGLIDDLVNFFEEHQANPVTYLFLLFLYSFMAAVVLPLPVEPLLLLNPDVPIWSKAIVLGGGKAVGALAVFYIGGKIESAILTWGRWGWFRWFLDKTERFVRIAGIFAVYLINSVPFMSDTLTNYLFSILNKEGKVLDVRLFVLSNFLAGINRSLIFLAAVEAL